MMTAAALLEELTSAGCYLFVHDGVGSPGLWLTIIPTCDGARKLAHARLGDIRAHWGRLMMLVIALGARN